MVKVIENLSEFKQELNDAGDKLIVVDFYATWCGPCKMIAPDFEEMANNFTNVVFLKVDVDEAEDVAANYGISAMPTFLFFKNGEKVDDLRGANVEKLRAKIQQHN